MFQHSALQCSLSVCLTAAFFCLQGVLSVMYEFQHARWSRTVGGLTQGPEPGLWHRFTSNPSLRKPLQVSF
ncbi:hypothetical protein EV401DRAFT_1984752 [Pisolithus croceorrhizus]|nr:hypothetical protein EV401DRAFT_1984752 [Pisolithus croceorrhizus]